MSLTLASLDTFCPIREGGAAIADQGSAPFRKAGLSLTFWTVSRV